MTSVLWADAEITGIEVTYDAVVLVVREPTGRQVELRCGGHIGLSIEGFWDEVVVASAEILAAHPFRDICGASLARRLGQDLPPSGSPLRDRQDFSTLVVTLIDGAQILCVASVFEAITVGEAGR
jgi:hypothetical protein